MNLEFVYISLIISVLMVLLVVWYLSRYHVSLYDSPDAGWYVVNVNTGKVCAFGKVFRSKEHAQSWIDKLVNERDGDVFSHEEFEIREIRRINNPYSEDQKF